MIFSSGMAYPRTLSGTCSIRSLFTRWPNVALVIPRFPAHSPDSSVKELHLLLFIVNVSTIGGEPLSLCTQVILEPRTKISALSVDYHHYMWQGTERVLRWSKADVEDHCLVRYEG